MWRKLVQTDDSRAQLFVRLALAIVIFPHGAQKMLGWFGGPGWGGAMGFLTQQAGLPAVLAVLVILIEFFAPIGFALGLLTRVAALGLFVEMLGAIATVHWPNGFFMNWYGAKAGEGFEYHLLVLGMCAALLVAGAGRWSMDARIARQLEQGGAGSRVGG